MTELNLYKFVHENGCEYHYHPDKEDFIMFVNIRNIDDFNTLLSLSSSMSEGGIECVMKESYFCFWMKAICEYHGIETNNIFTNKD